jgi:hypothetical protein
VVPIVVPVLRLLGVALVLVAAGCGGTSRPAVAEGNVPGPEVSAQETFGTPTPEGTGPEEPQQRSRNQPAIQIAGPGVDGGPAFFDADLLGHCVSVFMTEEFDADARVDRVGLTPREGFVRSGDPCAGDSWPTCDGYVFPAGAPSEGRCVVGIMWLPESGIDSGELTLAFSAVQRGTPVTFVKSLGLSADVASGEGGPQEPEQPSPGEESPASPTDDEPADAATDQAAQPTESS